MSLSSVAPGQMKPSGLLSSMVSYATVPTLFMRARGVCIVRSIPFQQTYVQLGLLAWDFPLFLFFSPFSRVPPSIIASFTLTLPPTHLLYLPKRLQIQLLAGSSGRQTQLHRYSWKEFSHATCRACASREWLHFRRRWPKMEPGWKAAISVVVPWAEAKSNNNNTSNKKRAANVVQQKMFLISLISGDESRRGEPRAPVVKTKQNKKTTTG